MKHLKLSVLICVSLCTLMFTGTALAASHESLVGDINRAFASITPYPMASELIESLSVDQAYDIQNALVKERSLNGEMVIGYKAGLTAAPAQKRFGVSEAVRGTLFKSMLRWPGTLYKKNYGRLFLETEIGFKFGKDLSGAATDMDTLKKAVSIVFPAIELPDLYYSNMKQIKGSDIIATNVAARKVLIGKARAVRAHDPNTVSVKVFHNGQKILEGIGRNALGDQWEALLWTVNNVLSNGGEIKKGHIVITGSITPMIPLKPGKYKADFGTFGTMAFEYR